jgi:putative transposase
MSSTCSTTSSDCPDGRAERQSQERRGELTDARWAALERCCPSDGPFDPVIVRKRQRRLDGIDQIVLSLTARGLTACQIAAHFDEVYGAKVSKDTISRITDKVLEEMTDWSNRPSTACTQCCSLTPWWSRSATGRSPTAPSTS